MLRPICLAVALLGISSPAWAEAAAHYALTARFDAAAGTVAARLTVRLPPDTGEETIFVLGERFAIDKIDAGRTATIETAATDKPLPGLQQIAVRFAAKSPQPRTVSFAWHGPLGDVGRGIPALSPERAELTMESMWLPVRQDLALRFTIDAELTGLPPALQVISQGRIQRSGDRLKIHRGYPDNDLPLDGAVGLRRFTGRDVEFYAADGEDPLLSLLREHAFGSATFYRELFGAPAVGPIRMVVVPRDSGNGHARRGFVVMPTFRAPGAPVPAFDQQSPARFVAHEFRHAWGDTPSTQLPDYWMSESVAEYFGLRYVEAKFGTAERDTMIERKRGAAATAGPISTNTRSTGAALYQKGPLLLFELEQRIGRPALDRILVRADPPATTAAFLTLLEEVAGAETTAWFAARLRSAGA